MVLREPLFVYAYIVETYEFNCLCSVPISKIIWYINFFKSYILVASRNINNIFLAV